jgi:predicted house-cleaning noncanonical NTP pyrophosphatase (MazG superfamily)
MKEKSYNKLVRDNIPEYLDGKGISYEKKVATEEEYKEELFKKLQEEIEEFLISKNPEELADIIEVVEALKKLPEFKDIENVRLDKLRKRGGFEKRFIVKGIDDR